MRLRIPFTLAALMLGCSQLMAADGGDVRTLEAESTRVDGYAVGHSTTVENRISGSFINFAGSPDNASALTSGLRQGTPINLTSTAPDGTLVITSFTPATGPMGYGNVRISQALAQQQLASLGITNPTPEQVAASLNGGQITYVGPNGVTTTTTLRGVLEQRAAGQGWGQIAQSYGTKLGPVIAGLKSTHGAATPPPTGITGGSAGASTIPPSASVHGASKGVGATTGKFTPASTSPATGAGHAYGEGIVSAYGLGPNGVVSSNPGKGHAYGATAKSSAPITTATTSATTSATTAGASTAAAAGVSTAHGNGNAYGQAKVHGKN